MIRSHVVWAVLKRNFVSYFSSPTGYVFITAFIFLSGVAAFWLDEFFVNNLANLDSLNRLFPVLLLFFIPAIAMSSWAEERKQGTEELLLTLPVRDLELVVGKYLAVLSIYGVSLLFSLTFVLVLAFLGSPDVGVMLGTYVGYFLVGAALLPLAMTASLLTPSQTVAFILGALFCAVPVSLSRAGTLVGGSLQTWLEGLGVADPFRDFTSGVVSLQGLLYFVSLAILFLYVNLILLGRRHKAGGEWMAHYVARAVSILVIAISVGVLSGRMGARADVTAERLHSLSEPTREILKKIDPSRPVYIHAYVSPQVPKGYVETRETLLSLLREYQARGGDRIQLRLVETEKYTAEAREAEERFNIKPEKVPKMEEGAHATADIFLGVAFTCGTDEVVIPFLYRGLSVEYELTRSIGTVAGAKRRKVGIATTDAKLFGGFDFQSMNSQGEWLIVTELKKQYDVVQVSLDQPVTDSFDALLVAMPSSLTQPQMDNLLEYIHRGKPAVLFDDPFPAFNPQLGPDLPKQAPGRGGMFGGPPPGEPKGNLPKFMEGLGITWPSDAIVYDHYNPHPDFKELPKEYVFLGPGSGNRETFNPGDPITSGLQEMVLLFPGYIEPGRDAMVQFTPLLTSTKRSGYNHRSAVFSRNFFGGMQLNDGRPLFPGGKELTLAARAKGRLSPPAPPRDPKEAPPLPGGGEVNVVFVADLDCISDFAFRIRRDAPEGLNFDNVTFVLNCVDVLAGDESFVDLRKRRPRHRTLTLIEDKSKAHDDRLVDETRKAEEEAAAELKKAQANLDSKVAAVKSRTDLTDRDKDEKLQRLEDVENKRFENTKKEIEEKKQQAIEHSRTVKEQAVSAIRKQIKVFAVLLPPIPALLIALIFFAQRATAPKRTA
jgi:ABC-2 type transport system permease protein